MNSLSFAGAAICALAIAQPVAAALQAAPVPAPAAAARPAFRFDPAAFRAYAEQWRQKAQIPGMAIAVVRGDQVLLMEGYGVRSAGKPQKVDRETVFNLASVTKGLTAAMIGTLVADKKLTFGDKVSAHIPGLFSGEFADDITLADLLSHRSGLATANYSLIGEVSRAEMLQRLRHLPRAAPFRTNLVYNNFGYVASAAVAEKVTGSSWEQLVRERLFEPLGLDSAVTSQAEMTKAPNRAEPHGKIGNKVSTVSPVPLTMVGPGGSIGMNIADLGKWLQFHLNDGKVGDRQILTPEILRTMQTPHIAMPVSPAFSAIWPSTHFRAYGLGWFMRDYRGVKLLEHGGNTTGFTTHAAFVPDLDFGIAILTNMADTPVPTALLYRALDMALGDPVRDWSAELMKTDGPPQKKTPPVAVAATLPLEAYVGLYQSALYGSARVTRDGDRLVLRITDQLTGDLTPQPENAFLAKWRDPFMAAVGTPGPFLFEVDASGRPSSLRLDLGNEKVVYARANLRSRPAGTVDAGRPHLKESPCHLLHSWHATLVAG